MLQPPAFARRRFRISISIGCACVALLAGVQRAAASPNYPAILDKHAGVECPRPLTRCLICHVTAAGGENTAKQPFAELLTEEYGFSGGKAGRELAMLLDMIPDDVDTDADGVSDQQELVDCANPSGEALSEGPGYGCSMAPGLRASIWNGMLALLAALALVPRRRARRSATRRARRSSPRAATSLPPPN